MRTRTAPLGKSGPAMFRLEVLEGADAGRRLLLTAGAHVIGRGDDCELVLTDPLVSWRHTELSVTPAGVVARDLDSKNGTFVAGARVGEAALIEGALLRLGTSTLVLRRLSAESDAADGPAEFGPLVAAAPRMRAVLAVLERIAGTNCAVLLEGETGTGKELCAEALHQASGRAAGPFIVCDLGAISGSLIESELFGHVKGAFTGAAHDRIGLVERAHGGTLFLDEIGELGEELQTRLLRVIERGQVKRVGDTTWRQADFRVVAATRRELDKEVAAGRFRADLFYRLAVVRVQLPPLRARPEDIPLLARRFLGDRQVALPAETLAFLSEHTWPGNVRELRNAMERALALLKPEATELPPSLLGLGADEDAADAGQEAGFVAARERLLATWERHYLSALIERAGGNLSKAARESGLDRAYLYRLLRKHGIRGN